METKKNVRVSYSLTTPLFLVFLILKLTGFINWSWWWVTSPLWIPLVFGIFILGIIFLIACLAQKQRNDISVYNSFGFETYRYYQMVLVVDNCSSLDSLCFSFWNLMGHNIINNCYNIKHGNNIQLQKIPIPTISI